MQSNKTKKIKLADRETCTGCAACVNVCPANCIQFVADKSLFYYPRINYNSCIECSSCMAVCSPLKKTIDKLNSEINVKQDFFCAWNKDEKERKKATSGGISGALAKNAINNGYYVCGASFDENWHLSHEFSNNYDILEKIRGSKYLQSDTSKIYKEIKALIDRDCTVLFFGTPCQIDAIQNIINKHKKNYLITCSIVCHGVNSPIVWKDYLFNLEKTHNQPIKQYNFRSKRNGWHKLTIEYELLKGKIVYQPAWRNLFHVWFGQHYILRESCFNCPYRVIQRNADITIGDFWGVEKVLPEFNVKDGVSIVITSTQKGMNFFSECFGIEKQKVDSERSISNLKGFIEKRSVEIRKSELIQQKLFEKEYIAQGFEKMIKLYSTPSIFKHAVSFIKSKLSI